VPVAQADPADARRQALEGKMYAMDAEDLRGYREASVQEPLHALSDGRVHLTLAQP
jgi:hypothetical protein